MRKTEEVQVWPGEPEKVFEAMNEFRECETCAAKPGAPVLCPSCASNRSVISRSQEEAGKPATARSVREPGAYGDFAKLMQLIVVEDCNSRTFYTTDGVFMGRYQRTEKTS